MSTAGRHFKIQIRIPSRLFDWIAFACQKRIVLRGDHEQRNRQLREVVTGGGKTIEIFPPMKTEIRCGKTVVKLFECCKLFKFINLKFSWILI